MQPDDSEIFEIMNTIFDNIGVEANEVVSYEELTDPDLYLQIFNIMFPLLEEQTNTISQIPEACQD